MTPTSLSILSQRVERRFWSKRWGGGEISVIGSWCERTFFVLSIQLPLLAKTQVCACYFWWWMIEAWDEQGPRQHLGRSLLCQHQHTLINDRSRMRRQMREFPPEWHGQSERGTPVYNQFLRTHFYGRGALGLENNSCECPQGRIELPVFVLQRSVLSMSRLHQDIAVLLRHLLVAVEWRMLDLHRIFFSGLRADFLSPA